ncbi:Ba157.5 [Baboon cytomegalovirus]|nr:Ba157.5 [Baboon cytomegalovirus]
MILLYMVCGLLGLLPSTYPKYVTDIPPACCEKVSVNYLPVNCTDFKICRNHTVSLSCDIGQICFPPNLTNAEKVIMPLAENLTREMINRKLPGCRYTPLFVRPNGTVRCASHYDDTRYILGAAHTMEYEWVNRSKEQRPFTDFNWFLNKTLEYGRNTTVTHGLLRGVSVRNATLKNAANRTLVNTSAIPDTTAAAFSTATRSTPLSSIPYTSTAGNASLNMSSSSTDNRTHVHIISEPPDSVYIFDTGNHTRELVLLCSGQ